MNKVSCKYRLQFNGKQLSFTNIAGKTIKTFPATSGRPGTTPLDQSKKNIGPIPEGNYTIRPKEADCTTNWLGTLLRRTQGDWGRCRVPIEPEPGTETFGRGGFKCHGGDTPGSAGCIDLGSRDREFVDFAQSRPDCERIPLQVRYPELDNLTKPWEDLPQSRPGGIDGNPNTPF